MGFTPEETIFTLKFDDPSLDGLEATVHEISTGELLDLAELLDSVKGQGGLAAAEPVKKLMKMVGDGLVEWNLTDKADQPVPADYEGVRRQPLRLSLAIAGAWAQAMAGVDIPLPNASDSGKQSPEASLPMGASSPNLGN